MSHYTYLSSGKFASVFERSPRNPCKLGGDECWSSTLSVPRNTVQCGKAHITSLGIQYVLKAIILKRSEDVEWIKTLHRFKSINGVAIWDTKQYQTNVGTFCYFTSTRANSYSFLEKEIEKITLIAVELGRQHAVTYKTGTSHKWINNTSVLWKAQNWTMWQGLRGEIMLWPAASIKGW